MKAIYEATIKVKIEEEIEDENIETKEYMDACFNKLILGAFSNQTKNSLEIDSSLEIVKQA